MLPVPPVIRGSSSDAISSRIRKPPVPCGPSRPLCPVKASASMFMPSIFSRRVPAVWAVSRMNRIPLARQMAPISAAGSTVPHTLLAWSITTALVSLSIRVSRSAGSIDPSPAHGTRITRIPCFASWPRGRITALCSIEETSTWSPGRSRPLSKTFRLSVTFFVKTTFFGSVSSQPKRRQSRTRVS